MSAQPFFEASQQPQLGAAEHAVQNLDTQSPGDWTCLNLS